MADLIKNPTQTELAPITESPNANVDGYLKLLTNPDTVLSKKGGGNYTIYRETLRDDQVKSTFQQRRLAVVASPWEVDPGLENNRAAKKAADALRENLKAIPFDTITDQMLFGLYYGHAVAEVMWQIDGSMVSIADIKVRDRARFRYGIEGGLFLQRKDYQFDPMPERKFWTFSTGEDNSDNPYGLGLAHYLYWPVYFKRSDIKFWLIFLEKFGMPTIKGTLSKGDIDNQATRNKLLAALNSVATDQAIIVPEGAAVELIEAARSGTADYDGMKKAMDAAIAKIVLSQTMTTDNGSSRSQAEVHSGVKEEVVKADADLICESFNRTVVKWWTEYNFPGAVAPRVWRRTEPEEDLNKRAERDSKIISLGYEPTEEYILETYGEGWVKKQVQEMVTDGLTNPDGSPMNPAQDPSTGAKDFAEALGLAVIKSGNRADHTAIVEAARQFAAQYETVMGDRVDQLLSFADQSGDYETFRKHLAEMMAEQPSDKTVEKVRRANFVSRLVGALRAQR